jgi:dihydroorotase
MEGTKLSNTEAVGAKYDLLIKGGEVIDPAQGLRAVTDVAFKDGRVAAIGLDLNASKTSQVVDASGKLVTPGLIDVHGHYFPHVTQMGISADAVCLPNGVTITVDAGSSGWVQFDAFKEFILRREKTRMFALVNLSALGMLQQYRDGGYGPSVSVSGGPFTNVSQEPVGELMDLRYAQVEEAVRCIQDNPNVTLGVKVRIDPGVTGVENAAPALERGREVADITGSFMMVHVARSPISLADILDRLRPGDIITHIFQSAENNILDDKGNIRPEVNEARSKGVLMDIGAASANFGVGLSRAAIAQGFLPDTISSDMTKPRPARPVINTLPELMTMFMGLGMSLVEVVAAATANGVAAMGLSDELGTLRVGAVGDAAVLELEPGEFEYGDSQGETVQVDHRLNPVATVKDGKVWKGASA